MARIQYLILVVLSLVCYIPCFADYIEINADKMTYDEPAKMIHAEQNVQVTSGTTKIFSDQLYYDMDSQFVHAAGSVTLVDSNLTIYGDAVDYGLNSSTSQIYNLYGNIDEWYFTSVKGVKKGDIIYLGKSKMTSCNLRELHYYIAMKEAEIQLGKGIKTKKDIVYVSNVPIFYLPSFYRSLSERSSSWEVQPSYNSRDGIVLKGIYSFPVNKYSYSKLYLDLLTEQGIGKGLEYNYSIKNKAKGSIYAYHIREEANQRERWKVAMSHWQSLTPTWFLQGNFNVQSDENFNQFYFTESWNRLIQEARSDIALTRNTSMSSLRFSFERVDRFNTLSQQYSLESYAAPRINYNVYTSKLHYLPVFWGFSNETSRAYTAGNGYIVWSSTSDFFITRDIQLLKKTILTPRLGIIEVMQDDIPSAGNMSFIQSRYYSQVGLRQRLGMLSNVEFSHNYKLRTLPNVIRVDAGADDYGIEENNLKMVLYNAFNWQDYLRFTTLYDLRNFRSRSIDNYIKRFNPFITELNVAFFHNNLNVYIKETQNPEPFTLADIQSDISYMVTEDTYYGIGGFYSASTPDAVQLRNSFYFWPTKKWHIGLDLISNVTRNNYVILDERLKIFRDLHCWQADLSYNKRGDVEEYVFNIGLKVSAKDKNKLYNKQLESQFYPWR